MEIIRLLLPAAVAAIVAGCASHPYQAAMPDLAGQCANRLSALDALPLGYRDPGEKKPPPYVEFASLSRCYRPDGADPVPVALFRLDGVAAPARIHVEVVLSTGGTFAAALDTLDHDRRPLAHHGFDQFVRRGSRYSLDLFLNSADATPAYLLLSPDAQQLGKVDTALGSANQAMPISAGGLMVMYNNGVETSATRPFLQGGQVRVTVEQQAPERADAP